MYRLYVLILLAIPLTSCVSYQYVQLSSDLPKTADTGHYYMSDSMAYVDFDFNGVYFPVRVLFLNESKEALVLDLDKSVFIEDGVVLASANQLIDEDSDETVFVPAGKAVEFEFRPFRSGYRRDLKRRAEYVELRAQDRKLMVSGTALEGEGREFEIHLVYRAGATLDDYLLRAEFKEEFAYFSQQAPGDFPGGLSPDFYYVSKDSEGGKVAANMLMELAAFSIYYYLYNHQ